MTFRLESTVNVTPLQDPVRRTSASIFKRGAAMESWSICTTPREARLVGGPYASSIVDLRTLPAGKYHVRVYDPFADAGDPSRGTVAHSLYDPTYNPAHRPERSVVRPGDRSAQTRARRTRSPTGTNCGAPAETICLSAAAITTACSAAWVSIRLSPKTSRSGDLNYGNPGFDPDNPDPDTNGTEKVDEVKDFAPGDLATSSPGR